MIKILYIHEQDNILGSLLRKSFNQANLEGYPSEILPITDELAEKHNLSTWHTVLFLDKSGNELTREESSFTTSSLEHELQVAKGILANRQKLVKWPAEGESL